MVVVIAIDGPAGSGKTSLAKALARKLRYIHLNSGLMYRVVAQAALDKGVSWDDVGGLVSLANDAEFDFHLNSGDFRTLVEVKLSSDASYIVPMDKIYGELASQGASKIAVIPEVRSVLSEKQREVGRVNSVVLEGRDAGSVVFPDADFKFYLEASIEERVWRRLTQLTGLERTDPELLKRFEEIRSEVQERDHRDMSREASPLSLAEGAEVILTDTYSEEEVLELLYHKVLGNFSA